MTRVRSRVQFLYLVLAGVLLAVVFSPALAQTPATLVVDASNGTINTGDPCATPRDGATYAHPQAAVNCAMAGDTIEVQPGTYQSNRFTQTPPHWTENDQYAPPLIVWKDNLTITASDGSGTAGDGLGDVVIELTHDLWSTPVAVQATTGGTWDGSRYVSAGVYPGGGIAPHAVDLIASSVVLEGFTINNGVPGATANQAVFVGGLHPGDVEFAGAASNNTVRNNFVLDSGFDNGVWVWQADETLIEGNVVPNPLEIGIRVYDGSELYDTLVNASDETIFRDNRTKYIQAYSDFNNIDNVHVGTIFQGNDVQTIAIRGGTWDGIQIEGNIVHDEIQFGGGSFEDVLVRGNYVSPAWPNPGVYINNATGVVFENNHLSDGNVHGLKVENSSGPVEIRNNTFSNVPGVKIHLNNVAGAVVSANIMENSPGIGVQLDGSSSAHIAENDFGVEDFGVFVAGNSGDPTYIVHNRFDTPLGVAVLGSADAALVHVNFNDFSVLEALDDPANTDAIFNSGANEKLDAECNWFGTKRGNKVKGHVTGPVDYTPWLNTSLEEGGVCKGSVYGN